jgi:hypothetical protein
VYKFFKDIFMKKIILVLSLIMVHQNVWCAMSATTEALPEEVMSATTQALRDELEKEVLNWDRIFTLIYEGADVNVQTRGWGKTALIAAAQVDYVNGVQILIGAGAKLNIQQYGYLEKTALIAAAEHNHVRVVQVLIGAGAVLNIQSDCFGKTALMRAAQWDHVRSVQALLVAGADPHGVVPHMKKIIQETPVMFSGSGYAELLSASLKSMCLKKLYEEYLEGEKQTLYELLQDKNLVDVRRYFSDDFLQYIQDELNPWLTAADVVNNQRTRFFVRTIQREAQALLARKQVKNCKVLQKFLRFNQAPRLLIEQEQTVERDKIFQHYVYALSVATQQEERNVGLRLSRARLENRWSKTYFD